MRIAIFSNTYWPSVNGVAISIRNTRRALTDMGHEVTVIAPASKAIKPPGDEPRTIRLPSFPAPVEADYLLALPYPQPLMHALRHHEFDVIHTHHPMWVGVWGQWYARWTGTPVVTTIHTQYEFYSRLIPLPDVLIDAFVYVRVVTYCNRCDYVTTPGDSTRERLVRQGVKTPIEVVTNPTDVAAYKDVDGSEIRRQVGCGPDTVLIGYIGRLAEEKNLHTALSAGLSVLQQRPQTRMLIVGDGVARPRLEAMVAENGLGDRVVFTGAVTHDEVSRYHAALDVYITASFFEVQPLAYAEAMAAGTPLVAYEAPGASDMISPGYSGYLVSPAAGTQGLIDHTLRLVDDVPLRQQMSQQARIWAQRFSRETSVGSLLGVYEKAIARRQA